jgi:hypothetical protein
MAGCLIVGMPRCGKGLYAKKVLIPSLIATGRPVAVLDPMTAQITRAKAREIWGAHWVFADAAPCVEAAKLSTGTTFIVDEMGILCEDYKTRVMLEYLAKAAGNYGNLGVFVAQRMTMLHPNFRNLAESAVVFGQAECELEGLATLFRCRDIMRAATFKKGQGMVVEPFKAPRYFDLWKDYPAAFPDR